MRKNVLSIGINVLMSIAVVIIISDYSILGKTTYGKIGMWYTICFSIIIGLLVITTVMFMKMPLVGDLYQGICLCVFVILIIVSFFSLTNFLELSGIFIGLLGIANCSEYFLSKI